jgi:hypothetical protein
MEAQAVDINAASEEGSVQTLHEGEDYVIKETNHFLYLKWKNGLLIPYQTRHLVDDVLSIERRYRFADRDAWYHLRLRTLRDVAELMQADARAREEEERQKRIDGLVSVLFRAPTLRLEFDLSERDLAGGKFSAAIEVKGVQSCRFSYPFESDHVELTLATDMIGVIKVALWGIISDCSRQTSALTLHTDPSCVPARTSLKYQAMRQIAAALLARREDTAFLDATFKSVWPGFYSGPVPPATEERGEKRPRPEGAEDEDEEPDTKRARGEPRE